MDGLVGGILDHLVNSHTNFLLVTKGIDYYTLLIVFLILQCMRCEPKDWTNILAKSNNGTLDVTQMTTYFILACYPGGKSHVTAYDEWVTIQHKIIVSNAWEAHFPAIEITSLFVLSLAALVSSEGNVPNDFIIFIRDISTKILLKQSDQRMVSTIHSRGAAPETLEDVFKFAFSVLRVA